HLQSPSTAAERNAPVSLIEFAPGMLAVATTFGYTPVRHPTRSCTMLRHLLRLACAALALTTLAPAVHAAQKGKPVNVIVILADALGWGDLGCYGHPRFKTPHLDALAKRGAMLTHFYTPVPFCAPTRGSLMTGRVPPRNGLITNPLPKADPLYKSGD